MYHCFVLFCKNSHKLIQNVLKINRMCGRYSFNLTAQIIKDSLDIIIPKQLELNFNLAPTQKAYAVLSDGPEKLVQLRWGLIPSWTNNPKLNGKLINARIESIQEKPSFKESIHSRRCLILADSFYEWETISKEKYPYRILPKKDSLLVMAGIWDECIIENKKVRTFSIITTKPNSFMKTIHHRMPLILDTKQRRNNWLSNTIELSILLKDIELDDNYLEKYPISNIVNSVRNNGIKLHREVPKQGKLF